MRRVASIPSMTGHADVHQHDVGVALRRQGNGLGAVTRLPDDLDVGLLGQDHPESEAEQLLVVGEEHPDGHALTAVGIGPQGRRHHPAPTECRACGHRAALETRPLPHALDAVPVQAGQGGARHRRRPR